MEVFERFMDGSTVSLTTNSLKEISLISYYIILNGHYYTAMQLFSYPEPFPILKKISSGWHVLLLLLSVVFPHLFAETVLSIVVT